MERKVGSRKRRTTKAKKGTPKRRRRVSGIGSMQKPLLLIGGLGGGAIAARELNTLATKFFPTLATSPLVSGLAQAGVGYFLVPKIIKGPWGQMLGYGMIANGVMVAVVATGIISGKDRMTYQLGPAVNGTAGLPLINGTPGLPIVNGPAAVRNRNTGAGVNPNRRQFKTIIR